MLLTLVLVGTGGVEEGIENVNDGVKTEFVELDVLMELKVLVAKVVGSVPVAVALPKVLLAVTVAVATKLVLVIVGLAEVTVVAAAPFS